MRTVIWSTPIMSKAYLLASVAMVGFFTIQHPLLAADNSSRPTPDAIAAAAGALSNPFSHEVAIPPALQLLKKSPGDKITAMTPTVDGLNAYLLESPSGGYQMVYLSPSGNSMFVGVQMSLAPDGKTLQDVSLMQFEAMKNRFAEAEHKLDLQRQAAEKAAHDAEVAQKAANQARSATDAEFASLQEQNHQMTLAAQQFSTTGAAVPGAMVAAGLASPATTAPSALSAASTSGSAANPGPASSPSVMPAPAASVPVVAAHADASFAGDSSVQGDMSRFASKMDKATFLDVVKTAKAFQIGFPDKPSLYMVADPQCVHCHAAWSYLKPLIETAVLNVSVILINGLPGSEPLALSILGSLNPGEVWLGTAPDYNGQGSTEGVPITPASSESILRGTPLLKANMNFIAKVGVTSTPWLAYVGKDGKVYQYSGTDDLAAFLAKL